VYTWVDHTSEVELAIEAASERGVFEEAVAALAELLGVSDDRSGVTRRVQASAADRPALLAAWIEELVYLGETQGFVGTSVDELELRRGGASAVVRGVLTGPPPLVKAVTYHHLTFERSGQGYVATVVLDV